MNWEYAFNPEKDAEKDRAYNICQKLNLTERNSEEYKKLLKTLLGGIGENTIVRAPFYVDFGTNIFIGENCFINYNCVILDIGKVEIGDRNYLGPGVQIYAVEHKIAPESRDWIRGVPVKIEDDCWIGGGVLIMPSITVGRGSIIGAGSVVTKDVDENTIVAGNPARKMKDLDGK